MVAERDLLVAVLAAGRGARFGGEKLDAPCAGRRLGDWTLDAVTRAGLAAGMIVVPTDPPQFATASGWLLLHNERAESGLGTSLACVARKAKARDCDLLVLLADMPLVDPAHLRALAASTGLAATRYPSRRPGVPARFPRASLDALSVLEGDRGAGGWLTQQAGLTLVDPPEGMLLDVDTPAALACAERMLAN